MRQPTTGAGAKIVPDFPAFGWGLSLRPSGDPFQPSGDHKFPRLRAGTFIEAPWRETAQFVREHGDFPALGRGLSLRYLNVRGTPELAHYFPAFGGGDFP